MHRQPTRGRAVRQVCSSTYLLDVNVRISAQIILPRSTGRRSFIRAYNDHGRYTDLERVMQPSLNVSDQTMFKRRTRFRCRSDCLFLHHEKEKCNRKLMSASWVSRPKALLLLVEYTS